MLSTIATTMTDIFSKEKRSIVMSAVKGKNSKIEKEFAALLKHLNIKYRSHPKLLPGKPDFRLVNQEIVIFVDSCFWHGCHWHGSLPKSNGHFWKQKITHTKKRDGEVNRKYKQMGWRVVRIWEHNLKQQDFNNKIIDLFKKIKKKT